MNSRFKKIWNQTGAAVMSAALLAGLAVPAGAAVAPTVDEAYYGTLDYFGGLVDGSVVKSYRTNGNSTITDMGSYDEVINLTDRTEPIQSSGQVMFRFEKEVPDYFYFEGKTDQPYKELPFDIKLSYKMNGVEVEPEDMAGQTGVGEITLDIYPNENASEYSKNNFVLEAVTMLRDTDILSVEAPGAQIQKMGNLDVVLFMALPGEEQHFTLRVGADEFSFNGFTFMIEPATLAQLDMVKELRDAKADMEDSYEAITDSLNTILNSLDGLDNKLNYTADGLDQLNQARQILSSGKQQAYDEADATLASMTSLSDSLSPVVEHLKTAKEAVRESSEQMAVLSGSVDALRPELQDSRTQLALLQEDLNALNTCISSSQKDMASINKALGNLDSDLDSLEDSMKDVEKKTNDLSSTLNKIGTSSGPISKLDSLTIPMNGQELSATQIRAYHDQATQLHDAIKPALESDTAETFVNAMIRRDETIEKLAKKQAEAVCQKRNLSSGDDMYPFVYTMAMEEASEEYKNSLPLCTTEEQITQIQSLAYLYYNWDEIDSSLKEVDTFNSILEDANGSIGEANNLIKSISKPTSSLLNSLGNLMGDLDDGFYDDCHSLIAATQSLLTTAEGYDAESLHTHTSALISNVSNILLRTDTILVESKNLSDTILKYEPEAQTALDDAQNQVNASVKFLNDLNKFTTTFENLLKKADPSLDRGTSQTLSGLSGSLRQMSGSLSATDSLKNANRAIQELVEGKWDEYTGKYNNALNMDSQADMISITSGENLSPDSIQFILRSQEIKADGTDKEAAEAAANAPSTFGQRVMRMFYDIGAIFTGD